MSISPPPQFAAAVPHLAHRDGYRADQHAGRGPQLAHNPRRPQAQPRNWKYIVLHHTATAAGDVESIDRVHRSRKDADGKPWLGIGYHFVIGNGHGMQDGAVEATFRWKRQLHGAHAGVEEYNQHGIGICLIGNFNEAPPTTAQLTAVKRLIAALKSAYRIDADRVVGHGEINQTACPGKYFPLAEVSRSLPDWRFGRLDASPFLSDADLRTAEQPRLATSKGM
jgi:N-acetyl-anhydromuramyl-L-alanine amidase AmpD